MMGPDAVLIKWRLRVAKEVAIESVNYNEVAEEK
jgi:hypothetical protein